MNMQGANLEQTRDVSRIDGTSFAPPARSSDDLPERREAMSSKRRRKSEALEKDHPDGGPATHSEQDIVLSDAALEQFDAWVDAQLELLESRWIHTAAPAAASVVRRVFSTHSQRHSDQV
jgi:hypothetical protein